MSEIDVLRNSSLKTAYLNMQDSTQTLCTLIVQEWQLARTNSVRGGDKARLSLLAVMETSYNLEREANREASWPPRYQQVILPRKY